MSWVTEMHGRCKMVSFQMVGVVAAACALAASACATAQTLTPGRPAPADTVQTLRSEPSVTIGTASVRPVDTGHAAGTASAKAQSLPVGNETTTVVRASDNLVGVSSNDLVVIYPDTVAVSRALSGKPVSVKTWPSAGIVVVHVGSFDQLLPLKTALSATFPTAKFDLPVKYFNTVPQ
jgi:hypothetical protein